MHCCTVSARGLVGGREGSELHAGVAFPAQGQEQAQSHARPRQTLALPMDGLSAPQEGDFQINEIMHWVAARMVE